MSVTSTVTTSVRGARDASVDCVLDIAGRLDEFTKAMVISA